MDFTSFISKYQKVPVEVYPSQAFENPIVSVCVQTYQHSKFIRECLDGILNQVTDFPIEVLLGEDESTDGTREICIDYANKFPEKIRLFLHSRKNNIEIEGTPTGRFNVLYNLLSAKGKYIALCEGDDYWIDPYKLQKQVDFLAANEDYSICFHRVYELNEGKGYLLSNLNSSETQEDYTIQDLAKGNFLHTPSVIYRNGLIKIYPEWFEKIAVGDYVMHMLYAQYGKIKYLPEAMAVYRLNSGVWSNKSYHYRATNMMIVINHLVEYFEDNTILDILVNQQISLLQNLKKSGGEFNSDKRYLLYSKLIEVINEKDAELLNLNKNLINLNEKNEANGWVLKKIKSKLLRYKVNSGKR